MDYRFCCFGTYDDMNVSCLMKCKDSYQCKEETEARKIVRWLKCMAEKTGEKDGNDKA